MEVILQDLRYGLRSLMKSPSFAIVSTVTLALAIGVNTSVFSLVSVIIFADLPMQDTETVALVRGVNAELGVDQGSVSPADYFDLLERSRSFESLAALAEGQWVLRGEDQPTRVQGLQVTVGLTETWRLPPVLGRSFAEGEDREGAERVVMLTHGFWRDKYGGREDVLGETINLFAVFALLMAAIGIYGVMAYSVSQRTEEIGLRMALGAEVATVRWMVVSQGARLVGAGIALGLVASFVLSRLLGNIVFGITTTDRLTFIGMPVLLALVALMANLIPARRATKLDPASTLRGD